MSGLMLTYSDGFSVWWMDVLMLIMLMLMCSDIFNFWWMNVIMLMHSKRFNV